MEVVTRIPFLTICNANIQFAKKKLTSRFYITKKALSTIREVKLIDKKEFDKAPLGENVKVFMMHIRCPILGLKWQYI